MMHDRGLVAQLANILTTKYGHEAPKVASDHIRMWLDAGDAVTANLWAEIGLAVAEQFSRVSIETTQAPPVPTISSQASTKGEPR
jgi:hypothetical protein